MVTETLGPSLAKFSFKTLVMNSDRNNYYKKRNSVSYTFITLINDCKINENSTLLCPTFCSIKFQYLLVNHLILVLLRFQSSLDLVKM